MVARWIQQKQAKQKRIRRSWAKPYSMKGTGPAVLPGFIGDDGRFNSLSIGSRAKAGRTLDDPWLSALFKGVNSLSNEAQIYARTSGPNAVPRAVVLASLIQSKNNAGSLQGEQTYVYKILEKGKAVELRLYMGGEEAFFVERKRVGTKETYRRSIVYQRSRAMNAWGRGNICFVHSVSLPPPDQSPG